MDKIVLPRIDIMACHGVEERERTAPQPFRISVELGLDLRPAATSDKLENTVHYGRLHADIKSLAEENSFDLIETLAHGIADLCLKYDLVNTVYVCVEKCQAEYAGLTFPARVVIERSRP